MIKNNLDIVATPSPINCNLLKVLDHNIQVNINYNNVVFHQ